MEKNKLIPIEFENVYSAKGKMVNLCPHDVTVYSGSVFNPRTGKSRGGIKTGFFPSSGQIASAICDVSDPIMIEIDGQLVPTVTREFVSVTDLPDAYPEDTLFIVSSVYAEGAHKLKKDISKLFTPIGKVVDTAGKQIGCTGLIRYTEALEKGLFVCPEAIAG